MSDTATLTVTAEVTVTVEQVAALFASMDDDAQARFFCEVAKIAAWWRAERPTSWGADWQWAEIGKHLATCKCSTDEGREMVRGIYMAMVEDYSREAAEVTQ